MKRLLIMCSVLMASVCVIADPVEINGIYYNLVEKAKQAEVTKHPTMYTGYTGNVVIPQMVKYNGVEYSVTSIGSYAFSNFKSLTSVTIPNSVTTIGDNAFLNCSGLTSITIPNSVTSMGHSTFYGCGSLTSVTLSNSLTSIGDSAFHSCGLTSINIPNSVTSIYGYAFQNCFGLTSVTIPNSVTTIGEHVFYGCSGLTSVTIPNSVTTIGEYVFYGCSGLTSVTIPNSVTSIGDRAFQNCSGLTSVTIPNSVTSIKTHAFRNCSGLTSVTIPYSVTYIGGYVFAGCTGLTSITIPNTVAFIGSYAFDGCSGLTSITIPNSVTSIGDRAFNGCSGLSSVTIPNSVTFIGSSAFQGCSGLTSVTIPNSVTDIWPLAFYGCSGLTSVTIGNNAKLSIGSAAFGSCKELQDVYCLCEKVPTSSSGNTFEDSYIEYATLHVPAVAYNDYKVTTPWSLFGTIVTTEGVEPETKKCETPIISYENGELKFSCATEGVEYISEITDTDIKKYYSETIQLSATYNISVYAIKTGYENSDVVTATLCWIDKEPATDNITNGVAEVKARPLLVTNQNGYLTIQGVASGQHASVYNTSGQLMASGTSVGGTIAVDTKMNSGEIALIKIGTQSLKVMLK